LQKIPFTYGFRGKARWSTNRVFLGATLLVVLYVQLGRAGWCIKVAEDVPLLWKWVSACGLLGFVWVCEWKIQERVLDPSLPQLSWSVLLGLGLVALLFAVITADQRLLFIGWTTAITVLLYGSDWYYRKKLAKLHKSRAKGAR